ncbi:MAG: PspC domain-containing protein [Melioribacteraceae bacterium]|nr:PspC domain-containing protein [Melioribacteraceae bacterium]MCF8419056.1 PspC domain-containing protein [Melioribacteraceae bacterium]
MNEENNSIEESESGQEKFQSETSLVEQKVPVNRRLARSLKDRVALGVCGGIGEYFKIDPVIIRGVFIIAFFFGGWGIAAYIIAALFMPNSTEDFATNSDEIRKTKISNYRTVAGLTMLLVGGYLMLYSFGIIDYLFVLGISQKYLLPFIFIACGIFLIIKAGEFSVPQMNKPSGFFLTSSERQFGGVCGGFGKYFSMEVTLIRITWIFFTFATFGLGIVLYLLIMFFAEREIEVNVEQ